MAQTDGRLLDDFGGIADIADLIAGMIDARIAEQIDADQ